MSITINTQLLLLCVLIGMACSCETYCWTNWLDRDDPSGTGDWESITDFSPTQVCSKPVGIECQTTSGQPYDSTGEKFLIDCEPRGGLVCRNADQSDKFCKDYRVRFLCPEGTISGSGISCRVYCPTQWRDRDNPSGNCDCETLADFSQSQKCQYGNPVGIKCREKSTRRDYQDVGQTMTCNARVGGVCWNAENHGSPCKDYEVQFICTC